MKGEACLQHSRGDKSHARLRQKKTGASKLFSASVTVDDRVERSLVASMAVAVQPLGQELGLLGG
jgi:hypothetical protein